MASNNPFYVDPGNDYSAGLAGLGQTMQQIGAQRKEQGAREAAEKRFELAKAEVGSAIESGDLDKLNAAAVNYPEWGQSLGLQMNMVSEKQRQEGVGFLAALNTAGSDEERAQLYKDRIEYLDGSGRDPKDTIASFQSWAQNPEAEAKRTEMMMASLANKQEWDSIKESAPTPMTDYQREMVRQNDADRELKKLEREDKEIDAQLKRETNQLKQEELRLKLDEKRAEKEEIKAEKEKFVSDATSSLDDSIARVDFLINHPGREMATGKSSIIPTLPGTDAADFEAEIESFEAQNFLTAIKQMKGMGALSENEGKKLSAAIGAIKPGMSEAGFLKSMDQIKAGFQKARDKLNPADQAASEGASVSEMSDEELMRGL